MAFELPKVAYSGKILEIAIGKGSNSITVGGETSYPFHDWEGTMPRRPILAMEVWDMVPEDWPEACLTPFKDVVDDSGVWAEKCVKDFGAEAIVLQLKSTDPNGLDESPEKASEVVGKVLSKVSVPVIIWGSANSAKDSLVLRKIAEDHEGKNLLLGPVDEDNYKQVGAAVLGFGHSIISSSPIDVNLAKQLNILLTNLGVPLEKIIIDPTTGGLGYGMEYGYSVMERIRMAALVQEDDKLVLPFINNIGNEVWKSKEAKLSDSEAPELGRSSLRGILMEVTEAVALLLAGSNVLSLRHPETVKLIKLFLDQMMASPAKRIEAISGEHGKIKSVSGTSKGKPLSSEKSENVKKVAKISEKKIVKKDPLTSDSEKKVETIAKNETGSKTDLEVKMQAEVEAKIKEENEAKIKAKLEKEAKDKAERDAKIKLEAELKARVDRKDKELGDLQQLRLKRREEKEKRMAEKATVHKEQSLTEIQYGEHRQSGLAGPDAVYVLRSLDRWRLRGEGVILK